MPESLNRMLLASRKAFLAAALFSLAVNLLMLTAPLYMLQIFDSVLTSRSIDTLLMLTIIALVALATLAVLDAARGAVLVRLGAWLERQLGEQVLSASIIEAVRSGEDPSVQGLRDLGTVRAFVSGPSIVPLMDAPWIPIFLAVIFLLHPLLGWLALAGAVMLFLLGLANDYMTRSSFGRSNIANRRGLKRAEASVRNADVIEAMGMLPQLIGRWRRDNDEALDLNILAGGRGRRILATSKMLRLSLQVGLLGTGAWLVIANELTPGSMIAASILMARALAPVEQSIASWRSLIQTRGAYRRVKEQLEATPFRSAAMPLPAPKGKLSVEGLSFKHAGAEEPQIRNISFGIEPGEALGLVGPTASGKTTLVRLIIGNLVGQAGHARLDGMDVAQWVAEDLGPYIGYLPQDIELFAGTVRENIARMSDGEGNGVIEAAKLSGVHEMVLHLPRGYETEIGEGGAALSGGQRQRIALARAVYGRPRLVVLDEPNANLDTPGEEALLDTIRRLRELGATVIVIAHRPSVLRQMDKLLVLKEGRNTAFGPRDEVLKKITSPIAQPPNPQPSGRKKSEKPREHPSA